MGITEERWARLIEDVRQVSEANNSRNKEEIEETDVFKIVYYYDDNGRKWYRWYCLVRDNWEYSDKSFEEKAQCLVHFISEHVCFKSE